MCDVYIYKLFEIYFLDLNFFGLIAGINDFFDFFVGIIFFIVFVFIFLFVIIVGSINETLELSEVLDCVKHDSISCLIV